MIDNAFILHQAARRRMEELRQPHPMPRSGPGIRRRLARGLRKLADWLEPALQVGIPAPRHPT